MWSYLLAISSLAGIVLDERNLPIEGAAVLVSRLGAPPASGVSDADGRFRIEIEGSGPVSVEAHAPGRVLWRGPNVDPREPLSIVLTRAEGIVSGVVRDGESLDPIPGAVVSTRLSLTRDPSNPRFGLLETLTDDRGEFRLEGVGKGAEVIGTAAGYGRAVKPDAAPGASLELYLFPGTGIYGRILDERGEPLEGATISPRSSDPMSDSGGDEVSDAQGRFALLGFAPGLYRLFVRQEGFAPVSREVDLTQERDVEIELELSRGVTLSGRLMNTEEEGIAGKVSLRALDGGGVPEAVRARMTSDTDAEGFFSLGPLPPGEHLLRAEAREYGRKDVEVSVSGRAPEEDLGEIVLEAGLSIRGRVVDASGGPLENAFVTAFRSESRMFPTEEGWHEASTDVEGRFVFAGLGEGIYELVARVPGYGVSERTAAEPGKGAVTIRLTPAGSIRGTVVDPEGRPVPSFTARTRASDGRAGGFDRAQNEQGTFAIENVPEGEYAVEIQARNFVTEALSKVIVSSGEATDLGTLRLRRGGTIEGTVVDSSEEPVPGASIAVRAPGFRAYGSVSYDASSDRRGRFRIEGLPDGAVSLLATHPSYAQSRIERLEIDARAGTTEVEIVMRRGGALEGVVRSRDGSDIGGRTIQVIPDPRGFRGVGDSSVQTDPDGVFRFEHLPTGSAEVQLLWTSPPATYTVQRKEVEIVEGDTRYVEFLSRKVLVSGRVTRGGSPFSGVAIELWPVNAGVSMMMSGMPGGPRAPGPQYLAAVSGEDGYYELLVDEPGEYRLNPSSHGVGLPSRIVAIPDAESFPLDLDFGGATISGRVIDRETEASVAGAWVNARSSKPGTSADTSVQVGVDGQFELEVEPGEYTILGSAEGYGREQKKATVAEGGVSDLVLALSKGLRVAGRVLDEGGRGAGGLTVLAIEDVAGVSAITMNMAVSRSLVDGSFVLDGLSPGRYNVLSGNELAGFALAFGVSSGTDDLEMALRPAGKAEVRVVDAEGNPVPNAIVGVAAVDGRKVRGVQGQADADGRIALAVPRGNLTLKAALVDGREALVTVAVGGAAAVPVEIVLAGTR